MPVDVLRRLFDADVAVSALTDFSEAEPLLEAEQKAVARAVAKRRDEYAAGRTCARRALSSLGCAGRPVLCSLEDRRVDWPAGYAGTITHTHRLAAAAVVPAERALGIGLDAEQRGRLEKKLHRQVASDEEIAWICEVDGTAQSDRATALFSAKEAFYKAQYCVSQTFLGFHDVRYRPLGDADFEIELLREVPRLSALGERFRGRLAFTSEHVLTAMTIRDTP